MAAKDQLLAGRSARAGNTEAYYTDDGFAVGVAFILAILEQGSRFDSLHWFSCVRAKLLADGVDLKTREAEQEKRARARCEKARATMSAFSFSSLTGAAKASKFEAEEDRYEEEQAVHTLQLTGKRLEAQKRAHEMLFFSISGSRIFFKRNE